jgi:hypothetical protein
MKKLIMLFTALACLIARSETNVFPVLTVGGEVYQNAKLVSHTETNALFFHDGGAVRIAFSNLPVAIQKEYGYDAQKIAEMQRDAEAEQVRKRSNAVAVSAASAETWLKQHPETQEPQSPPDRIKFEYDKFEETTTYTTAFPIQINPQLKLKAYIIHKTGKALPYCWFHFISVSDDWKYLKYRDFVILYDDDRKSLSDVDHDGDVLGSGSVIEQMQIGFTLDEFRKIANAIRVEMKLGFTKMTLNYAARNDWRLLLDKYKAPEPDK